MNVIERILACEGCGYSGSTFGNADWLTVGMACPNGCGGTVIAFAPEQPRGAVKTLERIRDHANSGDDPALLAQHELNRIQRKAAA